MKVSGSGGVAAAMPEHMVSAERRRKRRASVGDARTMDGLLSSMVHRLQASASSADLVDRQSKKEHGGHGVGAIKQTFGRGGQRLDIE